MFSSRLLPGLRTHSAARPRWLPLPDWVFFCDILKPDYDVFQLGFCLKPGTALKEDEPMNTDVYRSKPLTSMTPLVKLRRRRHPACRTASGGSRKVWRRNPSTSNDSCQETTGKAQG